MKGGVVNMARILKQEQEPDPQLDDNLGTIGGGGRDEGSGSQSGGGPDDGDKGKIQDLG